MLETFKNNLIYYRKSAGFSQEQFAEMLGYNSRTVQYWESGKQNPDIETIIKMAEIFNVTLDELIKGKRGRLKQDLIFLGGGTKLPHDMMRALDDITYFLFGNPEIALEYIDDIFEKPKEVQTICSLIKIYVNENYGEDTEMDILGYMLPYFVKNDPQNALEKGKAIIKKYNMQKEFERYVAEWSEF